MDVVFLNSLENADGGEACPPGECIETSLGVDTDCPNGDTWSKARRA